MKVLVTGAEGQLGRLLVKLAPADITLTACNRSALDIGDQQAVDACVGSLTPDVIVNAAAYTAVDKAESEPVLAARVNAEGPRHLAAAAAKCGARLVHVSTDFVFDGQAGSPYLPAARTHPLGVYGRTKLAGETAVLETLPQRSVILRTAWVYAASGRNFLHTMLRLMRERGTVRVVADQVGTPTAAAPLAQVLWRLAFDSLTGVHHWTDAGVASWYDFAVAIAEEATALGELPRDVTVIPIGTADYPTPARRPPYSVLDKQSLLALGLQPAHWRANLRTVLREVHGG